MDHSLIPAVADILMGAAYADERLHGREALLIKSKMAELLATDEISDDLEDRLRNFRPEKFELCNTVERIMPLDKPTRRKIIELVAEVNAADGELDLNEDAYLRAVGDALGLEPAEYKDLALEFVDSSPVPPTPSCTPSEPPPIPKK